MEKNTVDFHIEPKKREAKVFLREYHNTQPGYAASVVNGHFLHFPMKLVTIVEKTF